MSKGARAALTSTAPEPRRTEPVRTVERSPLRVQPSSLRLSQSGDASEREADRVAGQVMAMDTPAIAPRERVPMLAARAPAPAPGPPPGAPPSEERVAADIAGEIRAMSGAGAPLRRDTRQFMEPRFRQDFANVRVHTGGKAAGLAARLGASAFTYGRDVFFGKGAYRPDSQDGKKLLAHELTHTIQQGETVRRHAAPAAVSVNERSAPQVQRGIIGKALDWIADKANYLPGFRLFTIVVGRNPINNSAVDRSGENILRALIEFIPGGPKIAEALENHGILQKGGKFIEAQFAALRSLGASLRDALMDFVKGLGVTDVVRPGDVWNRAKAIFTAPVDRVIAFGRNLVSGIASLVKEAILKPLGAWAKANVPKWNLLVGVLGKNPVSEEGESPASALIGAFMELIGQQEVWANIKKGNAVARAWQWFQGAMKGAKSLVAGIPGRIMATIRSLTIFDIVTLAGAFKKIVGAFASFAGAFAGWAGGTVLSLLEIILSVVAPAVIPYLKKAGGAFRTIVRNPIGFVRNLVAAGKAGFRRFAGNFLNHLKSSLIGWLTGALGGAGIYIPQGLNFREILKFALSVMGLTWANIRAKLVAATNETTVKALETGFDIVKKLVTEGPAAAWQQIMETLTNLKQMAIDAVMDFVKSKVVQAAITKLLSMLSPAGAFIQAIIAIYNTIMFFVERLRQIAQVAASFINSIAAIASGNIGPAAARVERTLAGLLTLVISFLSRIAGLGKVSDAVLGLIKKIRAPIDKALDKLVKWIVAKAKALGKTVASTVRGKDERTPEQKQADLAKAVKAIKPSLMSMLDKGIPKPLLKARMAAWKLQYRLTSLELVGHSIVATINPKMVIGEGWEYEDKDLFKIVDQIAATLIDEGVTENKTANAKDKEIERQVPLGPKKPKKGAAPQQEEPAAETKISTKTVKGVQIDMTERQAIGSGAAAIATGSRHELVVGKIEGQDDKMAAGHSNDQTYRPAFPSIKGIGAGGLGGHRGKVYDRVIKEMAGQPVGDWLALMTQNKELPRAAAPFRPHLEELWTLLYVKEPSHNKGMHKRDLVYSAMVNEAMTGKDALSVEQAIGSKGIHPATFAGAQAGAKSVTAEINPQAKAPSPKDEPGKAAVATSANQRRARETATLQEWFKRQLPALKKELPVKATKPTLEQLKDFVEKCVRKFVGERRK